MRPMSLKQDSLRALINLYSKAGARPLLFIGSGVSRSAGLPDWPELLRAIGGIVEKKLPKATAIRAKALSLLEGGNAEDYYDAASLLKAAIQGAQDRELTWQGVLRQILERQGLKPSPLHSSIASLAFYRIITTNYDSLLEDAISAAHRELTVSYPGSENAGQIEGSPDPVLFKLHGSIRHPQSRLILAREDYETLYGDLGQPGDIPLVQTLLRSATVIVFLGFGHNDRFLQSYFRFAMREKERGTVFAIMPRPSYGLSDFRRRLDILTTDLGVRWITYNAQDQHSELLTLVRYLSDRREFEAASEPSNLPLKPTVVMVYCGGTIGAHRNDGAPLTISVRSTRYDRRLEALSRQVLRWYSPPRRPDEQFEDNFEILWEIMVPDLQMFSENVSPLIWDALISKISSIHFKYFEAPALLDHPSGPFFDQRLIDLYEEEQQQYKLTFPGRSLNEGDFFSGFQNRYVLGIVLLTGTDTLSFTAAALSMALSNLPCAVIVTGANHPPDESATDSVARVLAKSDSWRNIMTSLYFLQAFGHRLTEIFVCFGDTVHHTVNLRKRSVEAIPVGHSERRLEPFMFRNLSFHSQYMFKLINGVFCNNYYPRDTIPYSEMVKERDALGEHLRHIRFAPFSQERDFEAKHFGAVLVRYVHVSPFFPEIDVAAMIAAVPGKSIRAILVESYVSGTYPTHESNSFSSFLYDLYEHGIPIILTSLYGISPAQQKYEAYPIRGIAIPVFRIYGVTPETALPMLGFVVGTIEEEVWVANKTVEQRIELIERQLKGHFSQRPSIVAQELQFAVNHDELFHRWTTMDRELGEGALRRSERIQARSKFRLDKLEKAGEVLNPADYSRHTIFMYRADFISLIDEMALGSFERIGIAPDGFKMLCDFGFRLGYAIAEAESFNRGNQWKTCAEGYARFGERKHVDQIKIGSLCCEILQDIVTMLRLAGYADISLDKVVLKRVNDITAADFVILGAEALCFSFQVNRYSDARGAGERYAAESYSGGTAKFFDMLANGGSDLESLKDTYSSLLGKTWQHTTRCIDWFVIGALRGVAVSLAQRSRINELAASSVRFKEEIRWMQALSDAAQCRVLVGDEGVFRAEIIFR
jgi:L-asparaginase/Glu-tRNA(Gln) amidotransferase subunit D